MEQQYEKIKENRIYSKIIDDIKSTRLKLFQYHNLLEYMEILNNHKNNLNKVLINKNYNAKKIENIILKSLTPIEARLLQYSNYNNTYIELEQIDLLKLSLERITNNIQEFKPYKEDIIHNYFYNYSVALFPINTLIKTVLFNNNFNNIIYVSLPKSTLEDPYSFYRLEEIKNNGKRHWKLDWRLEDISFSLSSSLLQYMITIFRSIYKNIFFDNDYRDNYVNNSQVTEFDLEQLLQNIIDVSNQKQFCINLQKIVIENSTYNQTENDKFNLFGDDTLQRKKFNELENKYDSNIFSRLFDNICAKKSEFLLKKNNLKAY